MCIRDSNSVGVFKNKNNVQTALFESKLVGYQAALIQITENLGRAEYAVKTSAPLIQLLDAPSYPLSPQKPSILKYFLGGLGLGIISYLALAFALEVFRRV